MTTTTTTMMMMMMMTGETDIVLNVERSLAMTQPFDDFSVSSTSG